MKLKSQLLKISSQLDNEAQAQQLLQWILGLSWSDLMLNQESEFPEDKEDLLQKSLQRLLQKEPLAYIRGYQDFYKYRFIVSPDVLIPRPETELLVEKCIELNRETSPIIFDLGTGSGCIGLSIAKELPEAKVLLFDSSLSALDVAKENGQSLKLSNVNYLKGQVGVDNFPLEEYNEKVDFVLANPPYIAFGDDRVSISTHSFEPHEALYAENNGLKWIHKWLSWSYDYLKHDGRIIVEFGDKQHDDVKKIVDDGPLKFEKFINDYANKKRFLIAKK